MGFERDARKAYHARLLSLPIPYARRSSGSRRKRRSNTTIETGHPAALYEDETTHNVLSKAKEEEEKSHGHENWHGGFIVIPKKSVLFLIFYSVLPYSFSDFFFLSHLFVKPTARRLLFPISFFLYGAKKIWNRVVLCFHSVHEHVSSVFFSLGEYPSGILSPHLERRLPHTCTYSWN